MTLTTLHKIFQVKTLQKELNTIKVFCKTFGNDGVTNMLSTSENTTHPSET